MKRRKVIALVGAAAVAAVAAFLVLPYIQERYFYRNPGQTAREQLNPWRRELMRPDRVVAAMQLRPGMTVVDLGSGYGFFTFALAQAVGEQGKVYATDSNPQVADFLAKQAERTGAKNVVPVVVQQFGLDPFYRTNTFDVAFACDVIPYLGNRSDEQAFLSGLSRSLKENGRLWVLNHRLDSNFDAAEFGDWSVARDALQFPGAQATLRERLRPQTLAMLGMTSGQPAGPCCALLLEDLNRMLNDPTLWPDIARRFQPLQSYLNPRFRESRDYLVDRIEQAGGFVPRTTQDNAERNRPLLRLLNRVVIVDLLDTIVWEKAFHVEQYDMHNWRHMVEGITRNGQLVPTIESAGYQLVQEHNDVLTTHGVWEFRRANVGGITGIRN